MIWASYNYVFTVSTILMLGYGALDDKSQNVWSEFDFEVRIENSKLRNSFFINILARKFYIKSNNSKVDFI